VGLTGDDEFATDMMFNQVSEMTKMVSQDVLKAGGDVSELVQYYATTPVQYGRKRWLSLYVFEDIACKSSSGLRRTLLAPS
jgi:hypothetical protein